MPVDVVRDAPTLADEQLTFDVVLCPIGEEELGSDGRDGGHICSRNHLDGREQGEREGFGEHDDLDSLKQRVMVELTW